MKLASKTLSISLAALSMFVISGCATESSENALVVTGSATVEPITALAATESKTDISMTSDGTYDGFEKFCAGESDINNASSAITQEFIEKCADNGVKFVELPIGLDALSLVVNSSNNKVDDLTMDELREIWKPNSQVNKWSDVRKDFVEEEINFVGRPEGSGTFSYFSAQVNNQDGKLRDDYTKTDEMDELAQMIADDENSLGFMGVGNYLNSDEEVRAQIKTLSIDGVEPSLSNAQDGKYQPLTRPLFIYLSVDSLENNKAAEEFASYYVDNALSILPRVFFYGLKPEAYEAVAQRLDNRTEGSIMNGKPFENVDINSKLSQS